MSDAPSGDHLDETDGDDRDVVAMSRRSLRKIVRLPRLDRRGVALIVGLAATGWLSTAIYKVQPDEQGVILRFGKWTDTAPPGLHFHLPYPIETVLLPKVTQINQVQLGNPTESAAGESAAGRDRQMLTGDENIVEADCAVFWKIKDARQYLFQVDDPQAAVKIAAEGALREVIGRTPIQAAMSDRRQQIADETKDLLQSLLDAEQAGVLITQVQLQRVDPPAAVIDAFNDVQRARADQERARNEAVAFSNDILARARGEAEHIRQVAEAYKTQVVNLAEGDANAFLSVYQSYEDAKQVTSWRMYLDSLDELLKKSTRVIVDSSGKGVSGVVPYLPLSEVRAPMSAPAPAGGAK
ncbi:MAG: FtsH protease activity modulator HflK [Roseiarcus sp.]